MVVMHQLSPIEIKHIQTLFSKADSLIISAGAGMGVDSGLPAIKGMSKEKPEHLMLQAVGELCGKRLFPNTT